MFFLLIFCLLISSNYSLKNEFNIKHKQIINHFVPITAGTYTFNFNFKPEDYNSKFYIRIDSIDEGIQYSTSNAAYTRNTPDIKIYGIGEKILTLDIVVPEDLKLKNIRSIIYFYVAYSYNAEFEIDLADETPIMPISVEGKINPTSLIFGCKIYLLNKDKASSLAIGINKGLDRYLVYFDDKLKSFNKPDEIFIVKKNDIPNVIRFEKLFFPFTINNLIIARETDNIIKKRENYNLPTAINFNNIAGKAFTYRFDIPKDADYSNNVIKLLKISSDGHEIINGTYKFIDNNKIMSDQYDIKFTKNDSDFNVTHEGQFILTQEHFNKYKSIIFDIKLLFNISKYYNSVTISILDQTNQNEFLNYSNIKQLKSNNISDKNNNFDYNLIKFLDNSN